MKRYNPKELEPKWQQIWTEVNDASKLVRQSAYWMQQKETKFNTKIG